MRWQGLRVINDPLLARSRPMEYIALPNLIIFGVATCSVAVASQRFAPSLGHVVLITWVVLEIVRWGATLLIATGGGN